MLAFNLFNLNHSHLHNMLVHGVRLSVESANKIKLIDLLHVFLLAFIILDLPAESLLSSAEAKLPFLILLPRTRSLLT